MMRLMVVSTMATVVAIRRPRRRRATVLDTVVRNTAVPSMEARDMVVPAMVRNTGMVPGRATAAARAIVRPAL